MLLRVKDEFGSSFLVYVRLLNVAMVSADYEFMGYSVERA
jgi:hypothetical protein